MEAWLVHQNYNPYDGTFSKVMRSVGQTAINQGHISLNSAELVPNIYDNVAVLGYDNTFNSIKLPLKTMSAEDQTKKMVYSLKLRLSTYSNIYSLQKYGILDFISDIAGVTELFGFVFGLFLFPLSHLSFELSAMKRMYVARTADNELLEPRDPIPDQDTGKFKRNVRFKFDNGDENKIIDN